MNINNLIDSINLGIETYYIDKINNEVFDEVHLILYNELSRQLYNDLPQVINSKLYTKKINP